MQIRISLRSTLSSASPASCSKLRRKIFISDTFFAPETVDGVTTYPVLDDIRENKGLVVVMMHRFEGDGINGSISAESLENLLQYACEKGDVDFITVQDLAEATPAALA